MALLTGDERPSTCTSDYWIWASNQTTMNNADPNENCGKWMIFETFDNLDGVWAIVKKATEQGKLGHGAKVGTRKDKEHEPGATSTTVICVYTYDWTDETDVMRVRQALRDLGFNKKLPYKSDADTYAGKYRATGHKRISKYYC